MSVKLLLLVVPFLVQVRAAEIEAPECFVEPVLTKEVSKQECPYHARILESGEVVVEASTTDSELYRVELPGIQPTEGREGSNDSGVKYAIALATGDLMVRKEPLVDYLYLHGEREWRKLPRPVIAEGEVVEIGGWGPFAPAWLYAPVRDRSSSRIALYHLRSGVIELIEVPRFSPEIPVMVQPLDWVQGILLVEEYLFPDNLEEEVQYTGRKRWIRVVEREPESL
ncbi:hypothetical protein [Sulfuriroseicoccus oceanibius]|uniref:Uncharacterized protein n=1 Tax=Sulfuriroseicoccus oceanibius TaxID=2707525 RepID=A0A6B3L293_9BACT|nr:hypothetical protein [Sulfuriroseicoccus oceanibius]QQL43823.1 hypothetical protein G3M56_007920 [Sulfuriroseicoccus oceanibius]